VSNSHTFVGDLDTPPGAQKMAAAAGQTDPYPPRGRGVDRGVSRNIFPKKQPLRKCPMTERKSTHEPPNFGNAPALAKRLKTSNVIAENKEAIANLALTMAGTVMTDFVTWDQYGNVAVKASADIPDQKLHGLKKIKQTVNKDGASVLEIELVDKVQVLRILTKAAGLDNPQTDEDDRPSILGINIKAPEARE
jgi:hypothetical protein